jgi:hypothetical protein
MSSERVFRLPFRKPQWMNSATTRTAGVYFAGALVYLARTLLPARAIADTLATVCHRPLCLHRCRSLLQVRAQWLRRAYDLYRLDPRHLQRPRHAHRQLDR